MKYRFQWEKDGFIATFNHPPAMEDIVDAGNRWKERYDCEKLIYQIWDFSSVEVDDLSFSDALLIAHIDKASSTSIPSKNRIAIVVNDDPDGLAKKIADHYADTLASLNTPWTARVFTDLESAKTWAKSL